jgi:hypothetical protein
MFGRRSSLAAAAVAVAGVQLVGRRGREQDALAAATLLLDAMRG